MLIYGPTCARPARQTNICPMPRKPTIGAILGLVGTLQGAFYDKNVIFIFTSSIDLHMGVKPSTIFIQKIGASSEFVCDLV